jgi:hypothetical protein
MNALVRFERYVEPEPNSGCWLWTGKRTPTGYGYFHVGDGRLQIPAHRWAYEYFVGVIPPDLHIDHLCRVPPCVNPAHLEAVTPQENFRRSLSGQRAKQEYCDRGHRDWYQRPQGGRQCMPCLLASQVRRGKRRTPYRRASVRESPRA